MEKCFLYVREARERGLKVPVVLMGYCNPFIAYGLQKTVERARDVGGYLNIQCQQVELLINSPTNPF